MSSQLRLFQLKTYVDWDSPFNAGPNEDATNEVKFHSIGKVSKEYNDMDHNLTEGRFKAYDHSEWHKCKWRSLP